MPMQSLLGNKHCLPLFHISKRFIWIEGTKELINDFFIEYMINPKLNINKALIQRVDKNMNTTFGEIIQPPIRTTLTKKNTRVLALLLSYKIRQNPKKAFRVLSFSFIQ